MIIGGSTGLRTMIALPLGVRPSSRTARLVVWVNSSMFARVPGPADFEATDAFVPDGRSVLAVVQSRPPRLVIYPTGAGETRPLERAQLAAMAAQKATP